ncbi:phosphoglycolate phosphatase, chromosomal [Comamonadaceae bacterium OS-1]|nr:phosphoglycolate phosphatase, chromosomal [Comamonadaceae bacterium OS-1]
MVDTLGDFAAALNGMLADLDLPAIAPSAIEPMVGKGSENLIYSVLKHVLALTPSAQAAINNEALFDRAFARYQHHYGAINGQFSQVYPGVVAGLQAMQQRGWKLACVTNKPIALAVPLLQAKGLAGFFSQVFGGDSFERKKPDPLPLLKTCEALGTLPAHTLVVGDSSNDAQAARAAGCPVLLVTYGYNHGEPVSSVDADGLLDSLAALENLLRAGTPQAAG